jgi:hypothetical protein
MQKNFDNCGLLHRHMRHHNTVLRQNLAGGGKAIHRKPHQQVVPARVVTGASKEKKDRDNVSDGTVSSKRQKWIGPKEHPEARAYAQ